MHCARAVVKELLVTLSAIAMKNLSPVTSTLKEVNRLLDYIATYLDGGTLFCTSNMQLSDPSGTSYSNEDKARRWASAHMHLSENVHIHAFNGEVLTIAQIIKFEMSSAGEAGLASLFINARKCAELIQPLT